MPSTITDELVRIIRHRQIQGVRTAPLTETTRQLLFGPRAGGVRVDSPPPASAQPDPPTRSDEPARSKPPTPMPTRAEEQTPPPPARVETPARDTLPPATGQTPPPPVQVETGPPLDNLDWEELKTLVAQCQRCPLQATRTQTVFGDGSRNARLLFIGEGPGREEDEQGIPFVGPAGQLLTRMITAMQFQRSEVYIANIVKCRPPNNRNPEEAEAAACLPYLQRQIELLKPEVIVLLGAVPLRILLGETGINRLHGQWREIAGIPTLPTFHPAYLLRVAARKREAWEDLKKVMRRLGKDPAQTPRGNT
jgi:DNA polymerase